MGTGLSPDKNIAQCDIREALRTRVMQDLNIKGLVACPDKVDMRAIIPVYPFAVHNVPGALAWALDTLNISGLATIDTVPVPYPLSILPLVSSYRVRGFWIDISMDAVARAAFAALNDVIIIDIYLHTVNTILMGAEFLMTSAVYRVGARAGEQGYCRATNHSSARGIATDLLIGATDCDLTKKIDFPMNRDEFLYTRIHTGTANVFAVDTFLNMNFLWEYEI